MASHELQNPQEGLIEHRKSRQFKCVFPLLQLSHNSQGPSRENPNIVGQDPHGLAPASQSSSPFPTVSFLRDMDLTAFLYVPCMSLSLPVFLSPAPPPHPHFSENLPSSPTLRLTHTHTPCQAQLRAHLLQEVLGAQGRDPAASGNARRQPMWLAGSEGSGRYQKRCGLGAITEGPADHDKHFTLSEQGAGAVFVRRVTIWPRIPLATGEWPARAEARRHNTLNQN